MALGTTGEPSALDDAERRQVAAACARVCGDRDAPLIVGAGTHDTRTTIARHEELADVPGVVASLAVVPYYVPPSEAGIVGHFTAVADRSPVPLVLYNVPYRTGRGLGPDSLLELAARPNVVDEGLAGRVADARARAAALPPVVIGLFAEPNAAVIKGVLHAQGRLPTPDVRLPLTNASKPAVDDVLTALARA